MPVRRHDSGIVSCVLMSRSLTVAHRNSSSSRRPLQLTARTYLATGVRCSCSPGLGALARGWHSDACWVAARGYASERVTGLQAELRIHSIASHAPLARRRASHHFCPPFRCCAGAAISWHIVPHACEPSAVLACRFAYIMQLPPGRPGSDPTLGGCIAVPRLVRARVAEQQALASRRCIPPMLFRVVLPLWVGVPRLWHSIGCLAWVPSFVADLVVGGGRLLLVGPNWASQCNSKAPWLAVLSVVSARWHVAVRGNRARPRQEISPLRALPCMCTTSGALKCRAPFILRLMLFPRCACAGVFVAPCAFI